MKTDEEKLKEMFNQSLEHHHADVPDFDLMWPAAEKGHRVKAQVMLKIAACIALLIIASTIVRLDRSNKKDPINGFQISTWPEPTKALMPTQPGGSLDRLTYWTSPTDFLLFDHYQNIK